MVKSSPPTASRFEQIRRRSPLPAGSLAVGLGVATNGLATYAFLGVTQRGLSPGDYAVFAVAWGMVLVFGPGLFHPLEQEVSRASAERASRGDSAHPVVRSASLVGVVVFLVLAMGLVAAWMAGLDASLGDNVAVGLGLLAGLAGYAGVGLVRGSLSGAHEFRRYGHTLGAEGLLRALGAAVFFVIGIRSVAWFVGLVGATSAISALIGRRRRVLPDGSPSSWREVTPALGVLLATSLAEALLLNVGPILIARLSDQPADPGRFLNALVVARLPLFFFVAVRVALLPNLARLAGQGEWLEFRRLVRSLLATLLIAVVSLGALGGLVGPRLVSVMFGTDIAPADMALLAVSSAGSMVALALSLALVAIGFARLSALGWWAGVLVMVLVLPFGHDPFRRVEVAMLAAIVTASASMYLALRSKTRAADA